MRAALVGEPARAARDFAVRTALMIGRGMGRRYVYERMTGREFSAALDRIGLTMRQFARLSGAREDRVQAWLEDCEDIPHHVGVLCAALALPAAMELARAYTDNMVRDSREPM
jgi:hypothetical protein